MFDLDIVAQYIRLQPLIFGKFPLIRAELVIEVDPLDHIIPIAPVTN